jgi:hypothetical protein
MARIIKIRNEYLIRVDAKTIPARDVRLIKCAPQLFNALQHATRLLSDAEAQNMRKVLEEVMGGKKTNHYKAEKMTGHAFYTVPSFDIEEEQAIE